MVIAQVLQDKSAWGEIGPKTLSQGLGGRETALVHLGMLWGEMGHEVTCYVPRDSVESYDFPSGGKCTFAPYQMFEHALPVYGANALVMWECPWAIMMPGIREMVDFACVEMQVAHMDLKAEKFEELNERIDKWCVLSNWAGRFLELQEKGVADKWIVHPNGVDISRWNGLEFADQDDEQPKFYYSSSPDRGLAGLLRAWPFIREKWPGAELGVAYGVESWIESNLWSHNARSEEAIAVAQGLNQEGITYYGKIGQDQLARLQAQSHALLYPCDPAAPTETGCITAVEAGASQSVMILSDADCLEEDFGHCSAQLQLPFDERDIASIVDHVWSNRELREELIAKGQLLAEGRDWKKIAEGWIEMFASHDRQLTQA